ARENVSLHTTAEVKARQSLGQRPRPPRTASPYCPLITPAFGCPRLGLLLDAIAPCLCHRCQCLRDLVGGHTLGAEIQHHPFGIVPPKDPINEIIRTSLQDMDRAHGAVLPSSQVSIFSHFLVGI